MDNHSPDNQCCAVLVRFILAAPESGISMEQYILQQAAMQMEVQEEQVIDLQSVEIADGQVSF